ncbi:MAG: exodeoxyribonuclease V subunit alpha [Desulfobacterales bacterium]
MSLRPEAQETEIFSAFDRHFGHLMAKLAGGGEGVRLAAALASRACSEGHVCLDLGLWAGETIADPRCGGRCPPLDAWVASLRSSSVVGRPGERRPLILDERGRLYLYRYWEYETRVAAEIRRRAEEPPASHDAGRIRSVLRRVFPPRNAGGTDWQKVAVAVCLLRRFAVITGGPGTGKTHTVGRLIAALRELDSGPPPRILLAAPTGKAAVRLKESLQQGGGGAAAEASPEAAGTAEVFTLHRLLRPEGDGPRFRHHAGNPLAVDWMVVDEVSMVDLALMAKLLDALPPAARLVLVGDRDQLASVEAGSVLGDICHGLSRSGFSPPFARRLEEILEEAVPVSASATVLSDCMVELRVSRRFAGGSAIARLGEAIREGRAAEALEVLTREKEGAVHWVGCDPPERERALGEWIQRGYGADFGRGEPADLLEELSRFKVLCALRRGPAGVESLNPWIERRLERSGRIGAHLTRRGAWYAGRPLLILRNDYRLRLFNGDLGICLPHPAHPGEGFAVFFRDPAGGIRQVPPFLLPDHETVWAMTVHKSQGSEFDEVLLILPEHDSPVLSRELLYTALTRARRRLALVGSARIFQRAVNRPLRRSSGLRDALWGENGSGAGDVPFASPANHE